MLERLAFNLSESYTIRHYWRVCLVCLLLFLSVSAQERQEPLNITDEDIKLTIESFKTDNPQKSVEDFKSKMPTPVSDAEFRREVHQKLEDWVIKLQIKNSLLEEKIRKLIEPVLNLYGRMDSYDIIILNNKTPFVRLDAGVVLILTTGLFSEAQNDDEILGYIAHEIGHEYFTDYTIFTKHLFELVKSNGRERALSQRFADVLAILELECDAFAAITLSYLGYDSLAFIEGIERTAKKYKTVSDNLHPPAEMRRKVVTGVLADIKQSSAQRRISPIFKDIKQIIARQP